jgi:subtilisin family serine protease
MRIRMLVLSLLLCMIVQSAAAGQRQSYIVQTEPRSSGNSETDVDAEAAYYQQMVSEAMQFTAELQGIAVEKAAVEESKIFHVYRTVMNGFAAKLTPEEVKYLESLPHVTGVYRERIMQVETTHTPELLGLNQLQGLWPESNYGEGVIVGMIDSGVFPESPSFSDHLMTPIPARWKGSCIPGVNFTVANCNKKIIGARYYYKGYEADVAPLNWTEHCKSARDTEGHGTHTSSTAIGRWAYGASVFGFANGTATGMAPRAHVAAYKVIFLRFTLLFCFPKLQQLGK